MRALVLGGSGLIGSKLVRVLKSHDYDVNYTFSNNPINLGCKAFSLEISDRNAVIDLIKKIKPDITFHTIALKSTDLCETNKPLARKINVEGTQNVVDACKITNSFIVYISTAFVFGGEKSHFTESDTPIPINYYGQTKLDGEGAVVKSGRPYLVTRLDQIYGWTAPGQSGNTVTKALEKLSNGIELYEISDWYNNPTLADNAAEVILSLFEKKKTGVYHVVGSDFLSRFEWACKIAEVFHLDKQLIKPKLSSELNLPAKRPNANLSNEKAQKDSGIKLFNVEEGLEFMSMNKN